METPSQQITKPIIIAVTDARGRKIEFRKLRALDRMRFFQLIGGENASNPNYMGIAIFAYSVTSIDDETLPIPSTRLALEAIVQRLDDDGVNAISEEVAKQFTPKDDEEMVSEIKNE